MNIDSKYTLTTSLFLLLTSNNNHFFLSFFISFSSSLECNSKCETCDNGETCLICKNSLKVFPDCLKCIDGYYLPDDN